MATPPEFYADENTVTRSVRNLLTGLGYILHTPAELYGSREAAWGARDEDWLAKVGRHRWNRPRPRPEKKKAARKIAAYRASRLQVFLLPGEARAAELVELVEVNLGTDLRHRIDTAARNMASYPKGPQPLEITKKSRKTGQSIAIASYFDLKNPGGGL